MNLDLGRLKNLSDIVMNIYLNDPAFKDKGYIIGDGVNDVDVRAFVAEVLKVAGEKMKFTQKELASLIGSQPSNWNEWFRRNGRDLQTEGKSTAWLFNKIIIVRLQKIVDNGPPPPVWPLQN